MSLSDVLKSLEEKLTFKKKAVISGISFELALLNYEQDQMINAYPDEGDDPISYYEKTRAKVLSYALVSIDGESFPPIVEVTEGDKVTTKEKGIYIRDILKKLPPKIVEKLFEVYIDFKDETDTRLNTDVEFQWYKTPEQRKAERDKMEKEEKKKNPEDIEPGESGIPESQEESTPEDTPIVFKKIEEKEDDLSQVD
jgi:hypothetical protein